MIGAFLDQSCEWWLMDSYLFVLSYELKAPHWAGHGPLSRLFSPLEAGERHAPLSKGVHGSISEKHGHHTVCILLLITLCHECEYMPLPGTLLGMQSHTHALACSA